MVRKEARKVLVISAVELRGLSWLGPQKDVVFLNPYETLLIEVGNLKTDLT